MTVADPNWRFAARGVAILALTLVAGVAAGFAMDRAVLRSPDRSVAPRPATGRDGGGRRDTRYESVLYERLDLTDEQRARIDSVLERGRRETDAYWDRVGPQLRAIVDSMRADIRATLTVEQQARYDSLRAERHRSRERDRERDREREREWERGRGERGRK